jgi:hypothetical protein
VLGREHSGRVRGVGLGLTPGKSTSYTSRQGSSSSVPTPRELEMAAEMERLKTLNESQNAKLKDQSVQLQDQSIQIQDQSIQLQEQNNKYSAQ